MIFQSQFPQYEKSLELSGEINQVQTMLLIRQTASNLMKRQEGRGGGREKERERER